MEKVLLRFLNRPEFSHSQGLRIEFGLLDECPRYPEERRNSRHLRTSRSGEEPTWMAWLFELRDFRR
jgi:hypothetical protein